MRTYRTSLSATAAVVTLLWAVSLYAGDSQAPDVNAIVSRMEAAQAANQARFTPYTLTRAYKFFDSDPSSVKAQVVAKVDFQPPATKTFQIEQESGNQHGISVAHKLLESEANVASDSSKRSSAEINHDNYDFSYVGQQTLNNRPVYVLAMTPKKKDKDKVKGQVWVDSSSFLIQRIEGDLVKSPSWWIKDIHLVINYGQIAGLWLQIASYTAANVRLFGRHSMLIQDLACVAHPADGPRRIARLQPARDAQMAAQFERQ